MLHICLEAPAGGSPLPLVHTLIFRMSNAHGGLTSHFRNPRKKKSHSVSIFCNLIISKIRLYLVRCDYCLQCFLFVMLRVQIDLRCSAMQHVIIHTFVRVTAPQCCYGHSPVARRCARNWYLYSNQIWSRDAPCNCF